MNNTFALVVGVANYQNINPLPPAVRHDARAIYDLLIDPAYGGLFAENVHLLVDEQATGKALREALASFVQRCNSDSTLVVYVSSHGGRIESGANAGEYLLPVDVRFTSDQTLVATAIAGTEFTNALNKIPARKIVVLFDCCHAGGIGQPKDAAAPTFKSGLSDKYYAALQAGRGRVILASSRSDEYSWVRDGADHSLFTFHLLAGLRGGIASTDGLVRIFDLFEYLQPRVTADEPRQHPVFKGELEENFAIAFCPGGQPVPISKDAQGFRYDAYISYIDKEPDATWVWDNLVPRLKAVGIRVAVAGDVEKPGVARVVNIERGVKQSKRTVVILSPAYLSDALSEFTNILAQTMGIQEGAYRLLPVKIIPFDDELLPPRIAMLEKLDLSHPRRAEREFERLVAALQDVLPHHNDE